MFDENYNDGTIISSDYNGYAFNGCNSSINKHIFKNILTILKNNKKKYLTNISK